MRFNIQVNGDILFDGPAPKMRNYTVDPDNPCLLTLPSCRHREFRAKCLECGRKVTEGLFCHEYQKLIGPSDCQNCEKRSPVAK